MSPTDYLEPGLSPITEKWQVIAGGVDLTDLGIARIEGLEDIVELTGDAPATAGDGAHPAAQRLLTRHLTITIDPHPSATPADLDGWAAWANSVVDQAKIAVSPLPNREALRLLRFRLPGYPEARRLSYRPASGRRAIEIATTRERVTFARPAIVMNLEAPNPVIVSDFRHDLTLAANETATITNAGTHTAVLPTAWGATANGPLTVRHLDYSESVRVAGSGAGTRTILTSRAVSGPGTRLALSADPGVAVPRWPLLRPGDNRIQVSAACTFRWRDTFA